MNDERYMYVTDRQTDKYSYTQMSQNLRDSAGEMYSTILCTVGR